MSRSYEDLKGIEKVALLIMLIKSETSAKLLQSMDSIEVEAISKAIAGLGVVPNEVVERVLGEFILTFKKNSGLIGNLDVTKDVLTKALDEEKANNIIENITGTIWDKFKKLDTATLVDYLKGESAQIISVVISKINNMELISEIMGEIPENKAVEVILGILSSGEIKPAVLHNLEIALNSQFSSNVNDKNTFIVEIFNNIDISVEKKLTEQLKIVNPELANLIKDKLFKFADIVKINDMGIQLLLKEIEKEDLKVALRYGEEAIKSLFQKNMSERVLRIIQSEIESSEESSEDAKKKSINKIASIARRLINEKKITLKEAVKV